MSSIPDDALPLLALFAPAFTPATFRRARLLAVAAVLTTGRRTVSNLLRTVAALADGAPSSYHRVLSQARWSGLRLAAVWARVLLSRFGPAETVPLVGDDTVSGHPGNTVYGKGRYRNAVRSGHASTARRSVLVALRWSKEDGLRHREPLRGVRRRLPPRAAAPRRITASGSGRQPTARPARLPPVGSPHRGAPDPPDKLGTSIVASVLYVLPSRHSSARLAR